MGGEYSDDDDSQSNQNKEFTEKDGVINNSVSIIQHHEDPSSDNEDACGENESESNNRSDKQNYKEVDKNYRELPRETKENIELNKSIINDLAEGVPDRNTTKSYLNNDTIQEIESIISEKRLTEKKYRINATRARRALDTLSNKASEVTKEIELYENKLRDCQQTN